MNSELPQLSDARTFEVLDEYLTLLQDSKPSQIGIENYIKKAKNKCKEEKKLTLLIRLEKVLIDFSFKENIEDCEKCVLPNNEDDFIIVKAPSPCVIKFRPYLRKLLSDLNEKYIISIISSLDSSIISEIIQKLDPSKEIFGNRVFSYSFLKEHENIAKYLLFEASEDISVVLDFEGQHWRSTNGFTFNGYIYVTPYHYFDPSPKIHITEILELSTTIAKNDCILFGISRFLANIHMYFYEKEVGTLVGSLDFAQRSIFKNMVIAVPFLDQETADSLDTLACRFGGKVINQYEPTVTHLIVNDEKDHSIHEASQYKGVFIVNSQWFIDCCTMYQKKEEGLYPVIGVVSPTEGSKTIEQLPESSELSSSEILFDEDISDSEEESEKESEEETLDDSDDLDEMMRIQY